MTQVVSSQPYCLEDSNQLTRPAAASFYHADGHAAPIIIDKHQSKRLYHLQRAPNAQASLHLDRSELGYEQSGYFESTMQRQLEGSTAQPVKAVYHRPTDMSNESMARFSLGKARLDPHQMVPSALTTFRSHPGAFPSLR